MLTDTGIAVVSKFINGVDRTVPPFAYLALDASNQVEVETDVAPISEITTNGGGRALAVCTFEAPNLTVLSHTFQFTDPVVVGAVCIMSAPVGGIMLDRTVLNPVRTFGKGDQVPFVDKVPMTRGVAGV